MALTRSRSRMRKAALSTAVGASMLFVGTATASAETWNTAYTKCNTSALTARGEGCVWYHVNVSGWPSCKLGKGTISGVFYRSWGCPGSPYYIY